jgi:putative transposase
VNAKRVYRLYREESLKVRVKRRKKFASHARVRPPAAGRVNEPWSMDFVANSLSDGRRIRVLTIIDSLTRECLALKVAKSLPSQSVTETLNRVIAHRGAPRTIQVDSGTEFTSNHFDAWAYLRGIDVDSSAPASPLTMPTSNRSTAAFGTSV